MTDRARIAASGGIVFGFLAGSWVIALLTQQAGQAFGSTAGLWIGVGGSVLLGAIVSVPVYFVWLRDTPASDHSPTGGCPLCNPAASQESR